MDKELTKLVKKMWRNPILDRLTVSQWFNFLKLSEMADEYGKEGLLPPLADCAWNLNLFPEDLDDSLKLYAEGGWVHETPQGWVVDRIQERPTSSGSGEPIRYARKRHASAGQRSQPADGAAKQAFPYYD